MENLNQDKATPLVSIVITSYNRADTISEAIQSALNQDYPNLEIIITDNCSTDNTKEVIQQYLSDKRVKFSINNKNLGMILNFKVGIEHLATGEYFVNLCSDDILPNKSFISKAINLTHKYPNVTIVRGKCHCVDKASGKILPDTNGGFYNAEFRKGKDFFLSYHGKETFGLEGTLLHRETFKSLNIFRDPENYYNGFDKCGNLSVLLFGNICFIDDYCYLFRMHSKNSHQVASAQFAINDFKTVEIPYTIALENKLIERGALDYWKRKIISNMASDAAKHLYKSHRKTEYQVFLSFIKLNYGLNPEDLKQSLDTKLIYWFFYFPALGRLIAKLKRKLIITFSTKVSYFL